MSAIYYEPEDSEPIPPPVSTAFELPLLIKWDIKDTIVPLKAFTIPLRSIDICRLAEHYFPAHSANMSTYNRHSLFRRFINRIVPKVLQPATLAWVMVPVLGKGIWITSGIVIADNSSAEERERATNSEALVAELQAALMVETKAAWYWVIEP